MTIIRPQKPNTLVNMLVAALVVFVTAFAVFGVLAYNHAVSLRYDIARTKSSIEKMEIANVELRRRLIEATDTTAAQGITANTPLVRNHSPLYLPATSLDDVKRQVGAAEIRTNTGAFASY